MNQICIHFSIFKLEEGPFAGTFFIALIPTKFLILKDYKQTRILDRPFHTFEQAERYLNRNSSDLAKNFLSLMPAPRLH